MKKRRIKKRTKKEGIWKESLTYLKETTNYVYLVVALFFLSALVGFGFSEQFVFFNDILRDIASQIEGLNQGELTWFILKNNVTAAFLGMVLGVFLGILPIINSLTNGALLGYVYALTSAVSGFGTIIYLVPHGIFELPAVFIALGLGIKLGMFIFAGKGKRANEFKRRFWGSLKVFLTIVLPLLIIAALIEGALIFIGR